MPTIDQLPNAPTVGVDDELALSQGGTTRHVAVGTLLAGTQAAVSLPTGTLLGRASLGAGPAEPITLGLGVALAAGALAATGLDHAAFPPQPTLTLTDTLVLNSNGQPAQMPVGQLLGLYRPGSNITIDATGTIAANAISGLQGPIGPTGPTGPPGPAGTPGTAASIAAAPATPTMAATDLVGISKAGTNQAIALANLLAGADISAAATRATGAPIAYPAADRAARRLDPRDFAANMFSGALSQDDAIGIQAAINYAESLGGGIVQLPSQGTVNGQLATGLVVSRSGVAIRGQTRALLSHDNIGPVPDCAITLRWTGAPGATMLRVAPPTNTTTGIPVSGCDIGGFLLDCAAIAATGAAFATMRHSVIDLMVTEATADAVLLDTVDIGEANSARTTCSACSSASSPPPATRSASPAPPAPRSSATAPTTSSAWSASSTTPATPSSSTTPTATSSTRR